MGNLSSKKVDITPVKSKNSEEKNNTNEPEKQSIIKETQDSTTIENIEGNTKEKKNKEEEHTLPTDIMKDNQSATKTDVKHCEESNDSKECKEIMEDVNVPQEEVLVKLDTNESNDYLKVKKSEENQGTKEDDVHQNKCVENNIIIQSKEESTKTGSKEELVMVDDVKSHEVTQAEQSIMKIHTENEDILKDLHEVEQSHNEEHHQADQNKEDEKKHEHQEVTNKEEGNTEEHQVVGKIEESKHIENVIVQEHEPEHVHQEIS